MSKTLKIVLIAVALIALLASLVFALFLYRYSEAMKPQPDFDEEMLRARPSIGEVLPGYVELTEGALDASSEAFELGTWERESTSEDSPDPDNVFDVKLYSGEPQEVDGHVVASWQPASWKAGNMDADRLTEESAQKLEEALTPIAAKHGFSTEGSRIWTGDNGAEFRLGFKDEYGGSLGIYANSELVRVWTETGEHLNLDANADCVDDCFPLVKVQQ